MQNDIKFWKGGNITQMSGNNIFVYGANPEFRNGFGAAKTARQFGAKPFGGGRGIVGNTYGLVTKNLKPNYYEEATGITYTKTGERSVSPEMIRDNIDELYQCALDNPDKKFFVAYMNNSKNLNGYSPKEMWDMFTEGKTVPNNIRFHESFRVFMPQQNITQAGQRKREGIAKLSEAYNIAKETGNVRTKQIKNGVIENKPAHGGFDYNEAIKVDNQPRENFTFFWHSPSPFSQWHPSKFTVKDKQFISAEQFMMYCKAKLFKDEEIAEKILELSNSYYEISSSEHGVYKSRPNNIATEFAIGEISKSDILNNEEEKYEWDLIQKEIKKLGRKVKNYDDNIWKRHRVSYVAKGNLEKFSQNPDLKQILLNTGNTIMAEVNFYDKDWAIGIKESDLNATSPSKWKGQNLLGKILTNLREKFKYDLNQEQSIEKNEPQKKRRKIKP